MPKHDFFSPKAISNRIKAKGLQKLRWYCEMCQKQCRDENGFKCHQTSDSHLRQMRIFAENPGAVMHGYSNEFERNFLDSLSRRHGTKRVFENHVHMNATKWETLTNFVKYLGKSGQCVVDETEKGWFIAWVDRDPAALARQAAANKKRQHDRDDEERAKLELKKRVKASGGGADHQEASGIAADRGDVKLGFKSAAPTLKTARPAARLAAFKGESSSDDEKAPTEKPGSMLDALMKEGKPAPAPAPQRFENWLHTGIVVKCVNKKVADGAYHKKKGTVKKVVDDFAAVVVMKDSGDELQLDQDDLETVIPAAGKAVRLLNGRCRGARG
eukprot:CAMPEP_0119297788 /NCGR_PEP_ID=MMETSP1329-20130426/51248_1 /TAXON_ID=114041 /ORGANISM="Genus nov. species nov., Strain RCC1024" /LENGTH=328 /DNA_ID=CAMNT_0007298729 /DNA_START=181 /DNA_END=1163 /DNA_ORIENTATION=+